MTRSAANTSVRPIRRTEYAHVAKLSVDAYLAAETIAPDDPYVPFLTDVEGRVNTAGVDVLVVTVGDDIVATVTMCPYGSELTEVCLPGEVEPRVLAVSPSHTRQGLAVKLVEGSEAWARANGFTTVTVCVASHNEIGHNLYRKLGFTRRPDRDWVTWNGVTLQTYTKPVPPLESVFCGRCGQELNTKDHTQCQAALELEPPRYCHVCKRRMVVQVTPTGWSARCKEHGEQTMAAR
ncbi:MAG: GNAT family N-acetyltransferase [Candidatus Nanopelagicales bacterium]